MRGFAIKARRALITAVLTLLLSGCSGNKVDELDRLTRTLKSDLADLRTVQAEQSSQISQIRAEIRSLTGRVEETQHISIGKTKELEQSLSQLKSRVPPPAGVPEDLLNQDEEKIAGIAGDAADQFKRALQHVRTGEFDSARQLLTSFTEANQGTAFTDDALFWLGITYDKLGQYDRAVVSFSEVFQKYPAEDMVAPALLYLAQSFLKMSSKNDAVLTLQKLLDEHPRSPYGSKARELLGELQGRPKATSTQKKVR